MIEEQKGRFLEIVLHDEKRDTCPEYFPSDNHKAFVNNMRSIAKKFHLEVVWKQKDEVYLL